MPNSMMTIEIYRHAGTWCFTDEARGLLHEPFVLGIPDIINSVIQNKREIEKKEKYTITFSANKFPYCYSSLKKLEDECGGSWYALESYEDDDQSKRGWLCPATLKFFPNFPETIYFTLT